MDGFLQQLGTGDSVKDYKHASKLFVGDNFRLAPKMGYLYHVFLDLDPTISRTGRMQQEEAGMLVKSVDLPKFTITTKTLNSYNKPNIVQSKMVYDPVNIAFHDDSADIVRSLWADYYTYYFRDMDGGTVGGAPGKKYSENNKYDAGRTSNYGFSPRADSGSATNQFLKSIRIYSLHQKKFTEYILVNPIITSFKHGQHQSGSAEPMQCDMTVSYEFVLYCDGYVSSETVNGFAKIEHYDTSPSPLTPAGGTRSIMGPGGIMDAASSVFNDINSVPPNLMGAAFKAFRGFQNASAMDLKQAVTSELTQFGMDILRGGNPLNRISIPTIGSGQSRTDATQSNTIDSSSGFSLSSAFSNGVSIATKWLPESAGTAITALSAGVSNLGNLFTNQAPTASTQPAAATNPITVDWANLTQDQQDALANIKIE